MAVRKTGGGKMNLHKVLCMQLIKRALGRSLL